MAVSIDSLYSSCLFLLGRALLEEDEERAVVRPRPPDDQERVVQLRLLQSPHREGQELAGRRGTGERRPEQGLFSSFLQYCCLYYNRVMSVAMITIPIS